MASTDVNDNPSIILTPTCREAVIVKMEDRYDPELQRVVFSFYLSTKLYDNRTETHRYDCADRPHSIKLQCRNQDNIRHGPSLTVKIPRHGFACSVVTSGSESRGGSV